MDERYREVLGERFPGASRAVTDERFVILRPTDPVIYGLVMSEIENDERLLMSIRDTAESLGISRQTLYVMIRKGDIPAVRLGGRRMIRRSDLAAFVANLERV